MTAGMDANGNTYGKTSTEQTFSLQAPQRQTLSIFRISCTSRKACSTTMLPLRKYRDGLRRTMQNRKQSHLPKHKSSICRSRSQHDRQYPIAKCSTRATLHVLRLFLSTTACPKWKLCDSSKRFKSITDLQTFLDAERKPNPNIIDYCARRRIDFKFIPSFSPWQGGLYEKMVHLFKTSAVKNRLLWIEAQLLQKSGS